MLASLLDTNHTSKVVKVTTPESNSLPKVTIKFLWPNIGKSKKWFSKSTSKEMTVQMQWPHLAYELISTVFLCVNYQKLWKYIIVWNNKLFSQTDLSCLRFHLLHWKATKVTLPFGVMYIYITSFQQDGTLFCILRKFFFNS